MSSDLSVLKTELLHIEDSNGMKQRTIGHKKLHFLRGSDPRAATCRGKLQTKRSKLNQEINKELRLRAGAENLYKATTNRKLKETVALELSFVNSNLQLLKEQLAELNSSMEIYQNDNTEISIMPMIPLGLKETKEIDFSEPFKDFILEHYSEDTSHYDDCISDFLDLRQAMRTPLRDSSGISLLFRYYNQLYFIERRFFPPDRSLGIYFEWFDSLTGVPSCQRTVAFEKACVLFNMGALYTQIGAKQDLSKSKGLDSAVDCFLRAAGTFKYICENFTNAPSLDLGPNTLELLVQMMLAQARECLFHKLQIQSERKRTTTVNLDLAQEAAQVAQVYRDVSDLIGDEKVCGGSSSVVTSYVPVSWKALLAVKHEYYTSLAHYHCSRAILDTNECITSASIRETLEYLHELATSAEQKPQIEISVPSDEMEQKLLGRGHVREALVCVEEAQRVQRMCRELKAKRTLALVLDQLHSEIFSAYSLEDKENDFRELLDPPKIRAATKFQLNLTQPDFSQYRVKDLFYELGPIAIFSAKRHWSAPRLVQLHRGTSSSDTFGLTVRGDAPVIVAVVEKNSLADFGGVKEGDFIVAIDDQDVKWAKHEQVVTLIQNAEDTLCVKIVTPMDRNYLKASSGLTTLNSKQNEHNNGGCSLSTNSSGSSSSGVSSGLSSPTGSMIQHSHSSSFSKRLSWNPFRKNIFDGKELLNNIILR